MNPLNLFGKNVHEKINKRGQMSLLIIFGVLILFIAFFFGYWQNQGLRQKVESRLFGSAVVPEQAQGVVNYMETCMGNIAYEGVTLLGYQGGYIEIPPNINSNPRAYLNADPITKIPYWVYGKQNINVPSLEFMEQQLEDYINKRFRSECTFEDFKGYKFNTKEIESNVIISDGKILVKLNSGMEVDIKETSFELGNYVGVEIPIDLKLLHQMAIELLNRETKDSPIEFITMNLISSYASDKQIPPVAGFEFSCNPRTWTLEKVGERITGYLSDRMRYMQVQGANNENYDPFYNNMLINNVFSSSHKDVDVGFEYWQGWPFLLEVHPNEGNILKPSTFRFGIPFLPLFCMTNYNFRYSLNYPLMINLEKEGFLFRFPIEVFIIDNYGGRQIKGEMEDFDFGEGPFSRFCEEGYRLSEPVKVVTTNILNKGDLEDVEVNYKCGRLSCLIGQTQAKNGEAYLEEKFPLCYNGEIRLDKEGYSEYVQELTTLHQGRQVIVGELKPYLEKEVEVRVLEISDKGVANERVLKETETVSVQFNRLEGGSEIIKEQKAVMFEGDQPETISLVPEEEYRITANLVLNEEIELPGGTVRGEEFSAQKINTVFVGGGNFKRYIGEVELVNSNKIILYIVSEGVPKTYEDYFNSFDINELSEKYGNLLELRFK